MPRRRLFWLFCLLSLIVFNIRNWNRIQIIFFVYVGQVIKINYNRSHSLVGIVVNNSLYLDSWLNLSLLNLLLLNRLILYFL